MPTVYRYQNDKGEGPYTCDWPLQQALKNDHLSPHTHPQPSDMIRVRPDSSLRDSSEREFKRYPSENYRYAFLTKEEAHRWFDGWQSILDNHGFKLVEVEASEVIVSTSGKQVAFK